MSRRQIVIRGKKSTAVPEVLKEMDDLLNAIAKDTVAANKAAARVESNKVLLKTLMDSNKLTHRETDLATADIIRKKGKTQYLVNVQKFKKKVTEQDFIDSVTVSRTNASKLLGGKELAEVCTEIPPEIKPPSLEIKLK